MKILVVDDSSTMRRIVSNVIKQLGVTNIDEAADGAIAWKLFQENNDYDVILSDINMPNMDGFEFVEKVRGLNKTVFIAMITTEGGKAEVIRALKLGANQYIVKPFGADILKDKLKGVLN